MRNIDNIASYQQVAVGQEFKSYSALCEYIGISVTKGKQRQLDQRRLQCYFTWEKVAGSNRLVITDTFYDAPKPYEDNRKGIHTTELGEMMQSLILATPWRHKELLSKSGVFRRMNLLTVEKYDSEEYVDDDKRFHIKRSAWGDYFRKLNDLFKSACTQLEKKDAAKIMAVVANPETGYILTEKETEEFKRIWKSSLEVFGAYDIRVIYKWHQEKEFWDHLDSMTWSNKTLPHPPLRKMIELDIINPQFQDCIDQKAFLKTISDVLKNNYAKWYDKWSSEQNSHGIGQRRSGPNAPLSVEEYNRGMDELIESLL